MRHRARKARAGELDPPHAYEPALMTEREPAPHASPAAAVAGGSAAKSGDAVSLARFVGTSQDDRAIRSAVFGLLDRLDIFVDNYYRNERGAASVGPDAARALAALGAHTPRPLADMLERAPRPAQLITHGVAALVVRAMSPGAGARVVGETLLPVEYAVVPALGKTSGQGKKSRAALSLYLWARLLA